MYNRLWEVSVCQGVKNARSFPVTLLSVGPRRLWRHPESSVRWRSSLLATQITVLGFSVVLESRTAQFEPSEVSSRWCGWYICGREGHTSQEGRCSGKYNIQILKDLTLGLFGYVRFMFVFVKLSHFLTDHIVCCVRMDGLLTTNQNQALLLLCWVVIPYGGLVRRKRFAEKYSLHLQDWRRSI